MSMVWNKTEQITAHSFHSFRKIKHDFVRGRIRRFEAEKGKQLVGLLRHTQTI